MSPTSGKRGASTPQSQRARKRWLSAYGITSSPSSVVEHPKTVQHGWQGNALEAAQLENEPNSLPSAKSADLTASRGERREREIANFVSTYSQIIEMLRDIESQVAEVKKDAARLSRASFPKTEFHGFPFPASQGELLAALERSRAMLALPDNWDEEGSPAYREETWIRAVSLLSEYTMAACEVQRRDLPLPLIHNGPEGSIDILWRSPNRELLLNVPAESDELPTYYGDNRAGGEHVEGELMPPNVMKWLLMWLLE